MVRPIKTGVSTVLRPLTIFFPWVANACDLPCECFRLISCLTIVGGATLPFGGHQRFPGNYPKRCLAEPFSQVILCTPSSPQLKPIPGSMVALFQATIQWEEISIQDFIWQIFIMISEADFAKGCFWHLPSLPSPGPIAGTDDTVWARHRALAPALRHRSPA